MKTVAILFALMVLWAAQDERGDFNNGGAANFVQGFLKGAFGEDYGQIEEWVTNFDNLFNDIKAILGSGSNEKIDWMVLIVQIGSIAWDLIDAVKSWRNMPGKVADVFRSWVAKIKSPRDIARVVKNATLHHLSHLIGDYKEFKNNWKSKSFYLSGVKLGDIPNTLFA